ncbi:hypothetical protein Ngar_c31100 [Candidatus Nitrososphaera gargensis Ga9.2]|uniref:MYM-type domain-containing protein n=1 Tax=Nitrososphaera gargensis (strain Ga9.2) TaxID=1237085 RepID=K0IF84_NITGG|nr:hypothetical protein [Candidatus Nitrososphaera gargensis]AFU60026.1 hypothetical protein Ngar_c31100 [Candidatus Nitrososphaera gargensis Ga9.2]
MSIPVPGYCANCGGLIKMLVRLTRRGVPSRLPLFCSEECAREYLLRGEANSLRW